jgi:hypothetical protein
LLTNWALKGQSQKIILHLPDKIFDIDPYNFKSEVNSYKAFAHTRTVVVSISKIHGLINFKDIKTKSRHQKKIDLYKGALRQAFI